MNPLSFSLIANALFLGFRHGIDWDHIAAITDIVGVSTASVNGRRGVICLDNDSLKCSLFYAFGHGFVVFSLGIAALRFAAILPSWIDPFMERIVGITLLALGLWLTYSLVSFVYGKQEFRLVSRWMLVLSFIRTLHNWFTRKLSSENPFSRIGSDRYRPGTAFGVGMVHGIGAETATQILLITAVGEAGSQALGVSMLVSFVVGMLISNALIAMLATSGFISSLKLRAVYLITGALVAAFSLTVGCAFVCGQGNCLPDLQHFLSTSLK